MGEEARRRAMERRETLRRDREAIRRRTTMSNGFKAWFVFCALLGLAFFGLIGWAVIRLVTTYT